MSNEQIPMMFRAQIEGRCEIQRLVPGKPRQQAYKWIEEWIEGAAKEKPEFGKGVQTKEYQITWRFVSNSGQDEGVIRPVIGAKGWPYYPGASMKGAFLRACTSAEAIAYCGGEIVEEGITKTKPGILRFHGGYPKDDSWMEGNLVDVVHPQENWQVTGENYGKHNAFIQISLYKPTLVFGISSIRELSPEKWLEIWTIWERAIARGIGSRVSAGYGQPNLRRSNLILNVGLKSQGIASQLINKTGEFRPNMFKAALRGNTIRLLSGVTDETTAQTLTKELWGGLAGKDGAIVGLLGITFRSTELEMDSYRYGNNTMPTYELLNGTLNILGMRDISEKEQKNLKLFVTQLVKFTLLLGGFGKSWRRVDHRLFFPDYLNNNANPIIGCHWQFSQVSEKLYCPVTRLNDLTVFLDKIYNKVIKEWVKLRGQALSRTVSIYREAWHPEKVQVWARIAQNNLDSEAIEWFHGPFAKNASIKGTELTGSIGQIGQIWHRMYPHYVANKEGILTATGKYVEILTIFPDYSESTKDFLKFLQSGKKFTKVWPAAER